MKISRTLFFSLLTGVTMAALLPACSTKSHTSEIHLKMASMDLMPAEVHSAPVTV